MFYAGSDWTPRVLFPFKAIPWKVIFYQKKQHSRISPINQVQWNTVEALFAQDFFDSLPDRA